MTIKRKMDLYNGIVTSLKLRNFNEEEACRIAQGAVERKAKAEKLAKEKPAGKSHFPTGNLPPANNQTNH